MLLRTALIPGVIAAMLLVTPGCSVEKTQKGRAPDVDVNYDPGRWPKFDVNWADVDVGTRTQTITVPRLEWKREQATVEVPYIDINAPNATDREERTITVELETPNPGYSLHIREVRAAGDTLWVISEMKETGKTSGGPSRVADQIVVNAPEDLNIRKVVVGQRPEGAYNQQYTFVNDMSSVMQRLPQGGGRVLYQNNA